MVSPYRLVNVGNGQPVPLMDFVHAIETCLGRTARTNFMPMQPGDMQRTWADASLLEHLTGFRPKTSLRVGVARFVAWYRDYYARHDAWRCTTGAGNTNHTIVCTHDCLNRFIEYVVSLQLSKLKSTLRSHFHDADFNVSGAISGPLKSGGIFQIFP